MKRFNSRYDYLTLSALKEKFSILDKPNYYDTLIMKNPSIKKLKRASVLIPISVNENIDESEWLVRNYERLGTLTLTLTLIV